jgi:hypothetical protein
MQPEGRYQGVMYVIKFTVQPATSDSLAQTKTKQKNKVGPGWPKKQQIKVITSTIHAPGATI